MSVLLSKEWWQIILIIVSSLFSVGGLLYFVIYILGIKVKSRGLTLSKNDDTIQPSLHSDYIEFCQAIRELLILVKNDFRAWCIENGIAKMSDTAFAQYKQGKCEYLGQFAMKFMSETCARLSTATIDDFRDSFSNQRDTMYQYIFNILDIIRNIVVEQERLIAERRSILDTYIQDETKELMQPDSRRSLVPIILQAGHMMVEIHELGNRELVRKQMAKIEEYGLSLYNKISFQYLGVLTKKLEE